MMQNEDPPFLHVGTEVSAKYKGAFCEAKVNKVVKIVKIKVNYKQGLGSAVVSDDDIKGSLKIGALVKANHPDKNQQFDAVISKIQDCSQYTVVFDDGDITTLRRTSLCLKSGRHFAESETLDQLPLTHPEHFGAPVVGGRRGGRRSRQNPDSDDSSDEEDDVHKRHRSRREEWEADIGKVVCVELGDKKKQKDNWFPGLVVAPTAQDSVKIETKKDYLVRSFQDGRYYTVPKKEASPFSREIGSKVSQTALKTAVEKAMHFLEKDELPPHWDRELLFGIDVFESETDPEATDSDSSDDEPREEKDHFVAQLYKFMEECGTPINKGPTVAGKDLDLYKLFKVVQKIGGFNRVVNQNQWKFVAIKMSIPNLGAQGPNLIKSAYKRYLHNFEDFYRKLGCTMVSNPRGSRTRHKSGRSIIRDCERTPRELTHKVTKEETAACSESNGEEDSKETEELKEARRKVDRGSADRKLAESETKGSRCSYLVSDLERSFGYDSLSTAMLAGTSGIHSEISTTTKERNREARTPRNEAKTRGRQEQSSETKTRSVSKETKKIDNDDDDSDSDKEQEVEITKTRSMRNRDESAKKDEPKEETAATPQAKKTVTARKLKIESANERSASSSSSCSTSSGSTQVQVPPDGRSSVVKGKVKMKSAASLASGTVSHSDNSDDGSTTKKRGRKKKLDVDPDSARDSIPAHVPVVPGDKLQVLYGPSPKESKVTYEAKVLEVRGEGTNTPQYYVHYQGWNPRHDEWIPRSSIASNITWTQNRTKKGRAANAKENKEKEKKDKQDDKEVKEKDKDKEKDIKESKDKDKEKEKEKEKDKKKDDKEDKKEKEKTTTKTQSTPAATGKRNRTAGSGGRERHESGKSDTSVTAGPGTRASSRNERTPAPDNTVIDLRRSKRNTTAMSEASDSEDYESDTNSEKEPSRSECHATSSISSSPCTLTPEPPLSIGQNLDETKDIKPIAELDEKPQIKTEDGLQSCGKDIDLKAIESEMKGLDKPIKKEEDRGLKDTLPRIVSLVVPASLNILDKKHTGTDVLVKRIGSESPLKKVEIQVKSVSPSDPSTTSTASVSSAKQLLPQKRESKGFDIYEFKEPEPFEFGEIRRKDLKVKSCGSTADEAERDVIKVKKKGRPKRDKDDMDKSESDSDSSLTPQKRFSPAKESTVAFKKEDTEFASLSTPEKKEMNTGLASARKSSAKKEPFKADILSTPDFKNQKSAYSLDNLKSPAQKITPDTLPASPRDSLRQSPLPTRTKLVEKSPIQVPSPVRPVINIRAVTSPVNTVRQQFPPNFQVPTTQIGTARFVGPVSYSGPATTQMTAKPVTIRTRTPNPSTYSNVQRNLSSTLNLVTSIPSTLPTNSTPTTQLPLNISPNQLSQGSIESGAQRINQQPLIVTPISSSASTYLTSGSQQIKLTPANTIVQGLTIKNKVNVQTIQASNAPPPTHIAVKPVTYSHAVLPQTGIKVASTFAQSTPLVTPSVVPVLHSQAPSQMVPSDITNKQNTSTASISPVSLNVKSHIDPQTNLHGNLQIPRSSTTAPTVSAQQPNQVIHLLAQVVTQPKESKALAKPVPKVNPDIKNDKTPKSDDKNDPKVIPFLQRQQKIFPHLMNRPDTGEKVKDSNIKANVATPIIPDLSSASEELVVPEVPNISNPETERLLQEASVEESIEAVVQRAREDQSNTDTNDSKQSDTKSDKKRRYSNRIKKVLSREFIPDTSEESDSDRPDSRGSLSDLQKTPKGKEDSKLPKGDKSTAEQNKKIPRRKSIDEPTDDEKENTSSSESQFGFKDKEDTTSSSDMNLKRESENSEKESKTSRKKLRSNPKSRLEDDVETGLGDLLCEETIPPGSPMAQDTANNDGEVSSRSHMKHEMPFASVPTGSNYGKRGTTEQAPIPGHNEYRPPKVQQNIQPQTSTQYSKSETQPATMNTNSDNSNMKTPSSSSNEEYNPVNNPHSSNPVVMKPNLEPGQVPEARPPQSLAVIDNTPPTTPESIGDSSDSPSRKGDESTASKSCRDSSEAELDSIQDNTKPDGFSEDSNTMDGSGGQDPPARGRGRPTGGKRRTTSGCDMDQWDIDEGSCGPSSHSAPNKRKKRGPRARAHDQEDEERGRKTHMGRRRRRYSSSRAKEEDSDHASHSTVNMTASGTAGRSKYNFCQELDPDLDAEKRIHVLQTRIQDLKKTYMHVKAELASIERRRKKLRKKEREKEAKNETS